MFKKTKHSSPLKNGKNSMKEKVSIRETAASDKKISDLGSTDTFVKGQALVAQHNKRSKLKKLWKMLSLQAFFVFLFCYLEFVFKVITFEGNVSNLLFPLLFGTFTGLIVGFICGLFSEKANFVLSILVTIVVTLYYGTQQVYYYVFKTYVTLFSLATGVGQVMGNFLSQMMEAIYKNIPVIILILLPLLFLLIFGWRFISFDKRSWKTNLYRFIITTASYLLAIIMLFAMGKGQYTPYNLYFHSDEINVAMTKLGIATGTALDFRMIFVEDGSEGLNLSQEPVISESSSSQSSSSGSESEVDTVDHSPNVLDIDFEQLMRLGHGDNVNALHEYFMNQTPTNKNEYTGMWKGYNLIYLVAEGFSPLCVDQELTPTLYKLVNEGFVFNNYYNPIWGVSTSDGEYVACTGLYPKSGVWSFYRSGLNGNDMQFCMGNQLRSLGYTTLAYHDHTFDYYHRDISHPNMGYVYKGVGNGLDIKVTWPESDLEMMQVTIPEYINEEQFHTYYMTVSGHLNYNFGGNAMAIKNYDAVADLDLSDPSKAYIACNIELDKALAYLLGQLEAAGKLENTAIVLTNDHYPYGLDIQNINELAGHTVETNFELYKSNLIMWSASMEQPIQVDKYCSSIDIIPTLSNLMGLDYDSRLLMGTDILSDTSCFVLFNNASFITDKCMYNATTGEVFPFNEGEKISDEYIEACKIIASNKRKVSTAILDYNYYSYID